MAGNLVKWWKHKILGGYKQFSVQECTTDSEELMYHQVRASSSCSAPPDLLLVSDRENNIPLRSPVVNIIGATTAPATTTTSPSSGINACHITSATNNNHRHNQKLQHQQHQLQQHHHHVTTQQLSLAYNGTKDISGNGKHQKQSGGIGSSSHSKHGQQQQQQQPQQLMQQDCQQQQTAAHDIEGQMETQTNNHTSTRHAHHAQSQHHHHQQQQQQQRSEEHIRLEEFTCDVSVEGGKSSQPLQFSFTFYDLDGHHGKITKDDIVGIVYTIYESIGKSVVVPHSGSKTINVRLTVSPEGKSKAAKNKKAVVLDSTQKSAPLATASQAARRLHRYRPRKLIKSDEEDDDSNSDKEPDNTAVTSSNLAHVLAHKAASKSHKLNKLKAEHQCCPPPTDVPNSPLDTIYDNLKAATSVSTPEACRECLASVDESRNAVISPTVQYLANSKSSTTNEAYMKHVASTRIKMLRKSRKQKHQDCMETRQRSLSVGNETCWKNRHLQKQPTQQQLLWHAEQQLHNSGGDIVDGVQLRNPLKSVKTSSGAQKRNSAECWKTALNRNDLISIIRESMEKNRLCFQLNGKPQANVSPIRHSQPPPPQQQQQTQHHQQHPIQHQQQQHNNSSKNPTNKHSQQHQISTPTSSQRQRSNTVSKIPTLIANHNNAHSVSPHHSHYPSAHHRSSSCANTISSNNNQHDTSLHEQHNNTNSSNNIYHHLQPHIPIYHQQMAINPAVIAAHNALFTTSGNGSVSASATPGHHGKMNLCGYDSFLHATICGGGLSHSPPPAHSSLAAQISSPSALASAVSSGQQQIATVQPIMSTNSSITTKHLSLAMTPNQIKTSKILRSGSYAQNHHHQHQSQTHANTTQNSPQYHGYQRLSSSSKHNLAALHLVSPTMEKPQLDQFDKWRRDQVKNYDQLLYAKLSEKLQQTNLVSSASNARESNQRRKHRVLRQRRPNNLIAEANNVTLSPNLLANTICVRGDNDYTTMLPLDGDPVECENLLGQTSDEESHSKHESPEQCPEKLLEDTACNRHVAEGTLVDLDDLEDDDDLAQDCPSLNKLKPLNADPLLSVKSNVHDLHLTEALEIEEDLEEDLDDEQAEVVGVQESGRNSAASNDSNNAGATLANTNNGANTSTTSSSLIHRYVHEHIHHHYHHFEEKEE